MLFDCEEIKRLYLTFVDESDCTVPDIVRLARSPRLAGERREIERVFETLPKTVAKEWRSRLLSTDHGQYKSAWFQIMLYLWLGGIGKIEAEPEFLGDRPDFLLELGESKIAIEARAFVIPEEERIAEGWLCEVQWLLNRIEEPSVVVQIKKVQLVSRVDAWNFEERVMKWLQSDPQGDLHYQDARGNVVHLGILWSRGHGGVATVGPSTTSWVDSGKLKRPLREKARQHKTIRQSTHPYVIAIYLEDKTYSAEEIVEAWFGRETVTVDTQTGTVVDQRIDMSGIHYFGPEIRHRTVSGTLVFRDLFIESENCRKLQGWYVQNPYAKVPIDSRIFPVEARFVVTGQDGSRYQMGWKSRTGHEVDT